LPMAGMMVRMACGMITMRSVCSRLMLSADAACHYPLATE
jgi:hypothetical protein